MVNMVEVDSKATNLPFVFVAGSRSVTDPAGDLQVALYVVSIHAPPHIYISSMPLAYLRCNRVEYTAQVLEEGATVEQVRPALMEVMESFAVPQYINTIDALPYRSRHAAIYHCD